MHQGGQPLWKKIFGNPGAQEREGKVLVYISNRLRDGASLKHVVREDYVRRNLSQAEVDEVISDPELLRAARERMGSAREQVSSGPGGRPDRGRRSSG